jgi:DNA-binding transcriptional MerR regulator
MGVSGLKEMTRRTGLTRRQLRYLEERGDLGFVARSDGRTVYSVDQIALLEHVARLRSLGVRIDEAAQIGSELIGRERVSSNERLDELTRRALAQVERGSRVASELVRLRQREAGGGGL